MRGLIAFLSRAEPIAPVERDKDVAEAIFVFAGGHPRKEFAAEVWRRGAAPVLIVSVGRFEWRRFAGLGLPGDVALRGAVEQVPPPERHFFVVVERGRAEALPIRRHRFGTRNEARALASLARERGWRSLVVISSGFHLRRVALVVRRALAGSGVRLSFAALPYDRDLYGPGRWWRRPRGVRVVLSEVVKLAVYGLFLRA